MKLFSGKKTGNLKKIFTPKGVLFRCTAEITPKFPLNSNDSKTLSKLLLEGGRWAALERFWSDGYLEEQGDMSWILPYDI